MTLIEKMQKILLLMLVLPCAIYSLTGRWIFTSNPSQEIEMGSNGALEFSINEADQPSPDHYDTICEEITGNYNLTGDSLILNFQSARRDVRCDGSIDSVYIPSDNHFRTKISIINANAYLILSKNDDQTEFVADTLRRIGD